MQGFTVYLKQISFSASLTEWKKNNARGIWFKVSLEQSEWVPVLAKAHWPPNGYKVCEGKGMTPGVGHMWSGWLTTGVVSPLQSPAWTCCFRLQLEQVAGQAGSGVASGWLRHQLAGTWLTGAGVPLVVCWSKGTTPRGRVNPWRTSVRGSDETSAALVEKASVKKAGRTLEALRRVFRSTDAKASYVNNWHFCWAHCIIFLPAAGFLCVSSTFVIFGCQTSGLGLAETLLPSLGRMAANGFMFHHAKPEYVMMCRWLPEMEANNIPCFAHTMIGVGAVVVNSERQILVVREKYYADVPHWKLPGGYVEQRCGLPLEKMLPSRSAGQWWTSLVQAGGSCSLRSLRMQSDPTWGSIGSADRDLKWARSGYSNLKWGHSGSVDREIPMARTISSGDAVAQWLEHSQLGPQLPSGDSTLKWSHRGPVARAIPSRAAAAEWIERSRVGPQWLERSQWPSGLSDPKWGRSGLSDPKWGRSGSVARAVLNEDLADAAVREVLEETGVSTEFQFLVTFRHTQGINFDCSDIYFIVCLKPVSNEITMCKREIAACQWMKGMLVQTRYPSSYCSPEKQSRQHQVHNIVLLADPQPPHNLAKLVPQHSEGGKHLVYSELQLKIRDDSTASALWNFLTPVAEAITHCTPKTTEHLRDILEDIADQKPQQLFSSCRPAICSHRETGPSRGSGRCCSAFLTTSRCESSRTPLVTGHDMHVPSGPSLCRVDGDGND
ncbi:hypothetical protein PR048_008721 [Dryococelus australis]|uniref:Nudix hydrolase domain-containing protein n=1 Tax=Dryococelus australis TaxID=614101 RepID=A0ABQ9HZQ6_9NEOP|nr:hypothetical protein PR048_008721 [Dryococelus australis]